MPGPDQEFWNDEQGRLYQLLLPFMQDAAMTGAGTALDKLTGELGLGVDWDLVNHDVSRWAREYTYSLVSRITDSSQRYLQRSVSNWIETGAPLKDLVEGLTPMFGPVRADMIASTETTRAYQEGNVNAWGKTGFINQFRYQTAEDERVCPICGPLDGKLFYLSDKAHSPPLHPRCRCFSHPEIST